MSSIYLLGPIDPSEQNDYYAGWIHIDKTEIEKLWQELIKPFRLILSGAFPAMELELPFQKISPMQGAQVGNEGRKIAMQQMNAGYNPSFDAHLYYTTETPTSNILHLSRAQAAYLNAELTSYMINHLICLAEEQIYSRFNHLFPRNDETPLYYEENLLQSCIKVPESVIHLESEVPVFIFESQKTFTSKDMDQGEFREIMDSLVKLSPKSAYGLALLSNADFRAPLFYGNVNPALQAIWRNSGYAYTVSETSFIYKNGEYFDSLSSLINGCLESLGMMREWLRKFERMNTISEFHPDTSWAIGSFVYFIR